MNALKYSGAILVVGADGMIGRSLAKHLVSEGKRVLRTTRRRGGEGLFIDMAQDATTWRPPEPIGTAFLCAAVTSLDACKEQPGLSEAINVDATIALARTLHAQGAWIAFLSTNQVFDGTRERQNADAPFNPQTEYGRQKAMAERRLGNSACIVRLTKVLGQGSRLLCQWRDALRDRQVIHPFADMVMSPISLPFVVEALSRLAGQQPSGVIQISSDRDITYEEAARHIAMKIGADPNLIQPIHAANASGKLEHIPRHTTLDTTRLIQELGLTPPDVWAAVDLAISA